MRLRPTAAQLEAAHLGTTHDVIAPGLRILFVGINPGLWSGATGFHFARPGNRFWRTLYEAGLTPTLLTPDRQEELLRHGIGVTNLVARTTTSAAELTPTELREGAQRLLDKLERFRPAKVAFLGVSAYRVAYLEPTASVGRQSRRLADAEVWLLPNPSGLNAHYQLPQLVAAYRQLATDDGR